MFRSHKLYLFLQDMSYWEQYVNLPGVRRAIHVGNLTFNDGSVVETHLMEDIMKSVKPWIEEVRGNFKRGFGVLFFCLFVFYIQH